MDLEWVNPYRMALCPTRNILAPILETRRSQVGAGIGFWRCPVCLQWHIYLEPYEKNIDDMPGVYPEN